MAAKLDEVEAEFTKALAGGGPDKLARHRKRGKLTARERIDLLLDEDSPFLELCPLAAWGSEFQVGASNVIGIGVVEGVECMIVANDPTVRGGTSNPWTLRKSFRANEIVEQNRLPVISLVESGGADLPTQKEVFIPGGRIFRDLTRASAKGIPTIALVFGNSTAGGAYIPGMSDHSRDDPRTLQGVPRRAAAGQDGHRRGVRRRIPRRRRDARAHLRSRRLLRRRRAGRDPDRPLHRAAAELAQAGPSSAVPGERATAHRAFVEPLHDPEELLGIVPADLKIPFDPREVIARIVDGSDFDEFKPLYGSSLVTGWAELHGYPIGILANARGILFSEESQKAAQFIQLANRSEMAPVRLCCFCTTPPVTWSAGSTSRTASSSTAR